MGLSTGVLDVAVDAATDLMVYASLHSALPNASGSNEVTGGGYARQACIFGAPTGGVGSLTGTLTFAGPASSAVTHIGFWSAVTAGTFRGAKALTGDQTFNAAGEYEVTAVTVTGSSAT